MARATNSFPVPVSPMMSTVESVGATRDTSARTAGALLGPLAIVDVGGRDVPAHDGSPVIAEWRVADEKPPVVTILATDPDLAFVGESAGEGSARRVLQLREVVWMKQRGDVGIEGELELLWRAEAPEVERRPVRAEQPTVGVQHGDVLRDDLEQEAQLPFVLPDLLLGPLPIVDVGPRDVPANDASSIVVERGET